MLQGRSRFPLLELLVVVPLIPFYDEPQHLEMEVKALSHNKAKDKRLVVLQEVNFVDAVFDWERREWRCGYVNGGVDMWHLAELVVFARGGE